MTLFMQHFKCKAKNEHSFLDFMFTLVTGNKARSLSGTFFSTNLNTKQ